MCDDQEELKMAAAKESTTPTPSSILRWRLLRQALLPPRSTQLTSSSSCPTTSGFSDCLSPEEMKRISRKPTCGFNLVPHHIVETTEEYAEATMCTLSPSGTKDVLIEYNLSLGRTVSLMLLQRRKNHVDLRDFEICKEHEIDNTGVVCLWPSEEVLTFFCISNGDMFSTFFKEFHVDLAHTLKSLLALCKDSQAIFFSPRRGTTLDLFLQTVNSLGLHVKITENYNSHVWDLHRKFMEQDSCACSWPNYDEDHCYPLLIIISS